MKYPATIKNNESTSCKQLKESVTYFKENSKTKKIAMCMVYVKNKIIDNFNIDYIKIIFLCIFNVKILDAN